eukprot:16553-Heterococcus_DN1.PRE.3
MQPQQHAVVSVRTDAMQTVVQHHCSIEISVAQELYSLRNRAFGDVPSGLRTMLRIIVSTARTLQHMTIERCSPCAHNRHQPLHKSAAKRLIALHYVAVARARAVPVNVTRAGSLLIYATGAAAAAAVRAALLCYPVVVVNRSQQRVAGSSTE